MNITELSWVMDNRANLDSEDYGKLSFYDIFSQYDSGTISQNAVTMLEVMDIVNSIYKKYNDL